MSKRIQKLKELIKECEELVWLVKEKNFEVSDDFLKLKKRNIDEAFEGVEYVN